MKDNDQIKAQDVFVMWWYLRFLATPDGGWSWSKEDFDKKIPEYDFILQKVNILIEKEDFPDIGKAEAGCDPRHEQVSFAEKASLSRRAIWKKYLHNDVWLPKGSPKWIASKSDENLSDDEKEAKQNGDTLREEAKNTLKANFPKMFEDYGIPEVVPENLVRDTREIINELAETNPSYKKREAALYLQKIIDDDLQKITPSRSTPHNRSTNNQTYSSSTDLSKKEDAIRSGFSEGGKKEYFHLKSERNPKIRKEKLEENEEKYNGKITCEVCEIIPEDVYGTDCSKQVDVHHIEPLGEAKEEVITELKDLLVLCPNCHRFTHKMMSKHKKSLDKKELKVLFRKVKKG